MGHGIYLEVWFINHSLVESGLFALIQSLKMRLQGKDICEIHAVNNLMGWFCINDQETQLTPVVIQQDRQGFERCENDV